MEQNAPRERAQLITYADRLAGDLPGLADLLDGPLAGLFGGVHILPFFTPFDGADAGFDPADHTAVDPRLGTWDDVARIAAARTCIADLIVNHVSAESPQFRDVVERGDASPYAGMFLTYGAVYGAGASEEDLLAVYRPRPGLPFTPMRLGGRRRLVWTTFTPQQIDLDVRDAGAAAYLTLVLKTLAAHGVSMIRVDAVGYAVKTPGTSCFMTAQTYRFIAGLSAQARAMGLDVLVEVHSYYRRQIEIARHVDRVYDFAVPPLVLHALHTGDVAPLLEWMAIRPANAVTVLDTHDGIGVVDVGPDADDPTRPGLLTPEQIAALVEAIHAASGGASRRSTGGGAGNLDVYQVNCTFYDAVGRDDAKYLLARMIQLLTPGIPQVYYVGLLAGRNDVELFERTQVGREINRHYYRRGEVEEALRQPVVQALCALIRLRNSHSAFAGEFTAHAGEEPGSLVMAWRCRHAQVRLAALPGRGEFALTWTGADGALRTAGSVQDMADAPV